MRKRRQFSSPCAHELSIARRSSYNSNSNDNDAYDDEWRHFSKLKIKRKPSLLDQWGYSPPSQFGYDYEEYNSNSTTITETATATTGHDRHVQHEQQEAKKSPRIVLKNGNVEPVFPMCFNDVADEAFAAISYTLYNKGKLSQSVASNAMSTSPANYRPVKHPTRDSGRIGIEFDESRFLYLLSDDGSSSDERLSRHVSFRNLSRDQSNTLEFEKAALRRLSFILAGKLSRKPWDRLENADVTNNDNNNVASEKSQNRPVALFFNTLEQTLLASRELQQLKTREMKEQQQQIQQYSITSSKKTKTKKIPSIYDNIRICCLGQDNIPKDMIRHTGYKHNQPGDAKGSRTKLRRKTNSTVLKRTELYNGDTDANLGIVLIVRPSERDGNDSSPVHESSLNALQCLSAVASVSHIPLVLLSPRLQYDDFGSTGMMDSSGYEHCSTYGGLEPPKSVPWILRDFTPPAYTWVGSAQRMQKNQRRREQHKQGESNVRVGLTQSVMCSGHPWNFFAINNDEDSFSTTKLDNNGSKDGNCNNNSHYMGSTWVTCGRPSEDIVDAVLRERSSSSW